MRAAVAVLVLLTAHAGPCTAENRSEYFAPWGGLRMAGSTYTVPPGWAAADPFSDQTPYWPEFCRLGPFARQDGPWVRRVLLRSSLDEQSQIFAAVGPLDTWRPRIEKAVAELERDTMAVESGEAHTADGSEVRYLIRRQMPGTLAGADITFLFGAARSGKSVLLIDAGGNSPSFSPEKVVLFIRSLTWKEKMK